MQGVECSIIKRSGENGLTETPATYDEKRKVPKPDQD